MKIKSIISLVAGFVSLLLGSMSASSAVVGQPAPNFSLTGIHGKAHTLSEFKGMVVVLEWVNQECPFVVKHYESGNMPSLQAAAMADGVAWIQINSGHPGAQGDFDDEQVKAWQNKQGSTSSAYLRDSDGRVGRLYGAKTTPHMYVIGANGTLLYNGAIDSIRSANQADIAKAENYVRSALKAIKAGEPVPTTYSQPYGCAVKY